MTNARQLEENPSISGLQLFNSEVYAYGGPVPRRLSCGIQSRSPRGFGRWAHDWRDCRPADAAGYCGADLVVGSIRGAVYGNFAAAGSPSAERGGREAHGRCDGRVESVAVAAN